VTTRITMSEFNYDFVQQSLRFCCTTILCGIWIAQSM